MDTYRRQPPSFPPPFASTWGDDAYGLWAELEIPLAPPSSASVVQRLRWIEPGSYLRDTPDAERNDQVGAQARVSLSEGFWLADTACTPTLWQAVMAYPGHSTGDGQQSVERVSWRAVQEFLRTVAAHDSSLQLPTEVQWEYACCAGAMSPRGLGTNITTAVAKPLPNAWGLYAMHGNVREWCADGKRGYMVTSSQRLDSPNVFDGEASFRVCSP